MMQVLDKTQIAEHGIKGGWVLGLPDFVRYADLDTLNHVNNKVYHAWFENLRVLYLNQLGVSVEEAAHIKPVVRFATIEFIAPMFLGEEYVTLARVSKLGRTSFTIAYAVWCDGTVRATGTTVLVMVNEDSTKSVPVPEGLRAVMIKRDGAEI